MTPQKQDYERYYSGGGKPWQVDNYVKTLEKEKSELLDNLRACHFMLKSLGHGSFDVEKILEKYLDK